MAGFTRRACGLGGRASNRSWCGCLDRRRVSAELVARRLAAAGAALSLHAAGPALSATSGLEAAEELYAANRLDDAAEAFERVGGAVGKASAAALRFELREFAAAERLYDAALEDGRDAPAERRAQWLFGRANTVMSAGRTADAERDYASAAALDPARPELRFEDAQALAALEEWEDARAGYSVAADGFLKARRPREAAIARAQEAFAAFELGDADAASRLLGQLARQRPSSDVRVALAAVEWERGEFARAEDLYLAACQMPDARCDLYSDSDPAALLTVRRWTPSLTRAVADFVAMRQPPAR